MVVVDCNYERRYSFCNLIARMFVDFDGVIKARVGHRWITIETIPVDIIKVKIPLLPHKDLETVLYMISNLVKRIHEAKKAEYKVKTSG